MLPRVLPLLLLFPVLLAAKAPREVSWDGVREFTGKTLRITMPAGEVIEGKAIRIGPTGLVVRIRKTTRPDTYPKGEYEAPRDTLRAFEVLGKSKHWRIVGTTIGTLAGAAAAVGIELSAGIFARQNSARDAGAIAAFAGTAVGGYLLGNAADRKSETILIRP